MTGLRIGIDLGGTKIELVALDDAESLAALRELWRDPRLRVEPSSAIALAAA